jgi:hypothetical protein
MSPDPREWEAFMAEVRQRMAGPYAPATIRFHTEADKLAEWLSPSSWHERLASRLFHYTPHLAALIVPALLALVFA